MSSTNTDRIDVYSDNFTKIRVIDFQKLEKESLIVQKIINASKQENIYNFLDYALVIIPIVVGVTIGIMRGEGLSAFVLSFVFLLIVLIPYKFIKDKKIKNREKVFPKGTPKSIRENLLFMDFQEVEKALYEEYLSIQNGSLSNDFEYEILGQIESKASKSDLLKKAYEMKADAIMNYQMTKNTTSSVKSSYSGKHIDTEHHIEEFYIATALKMISDKVFEKQSAFDNKESSDNTNITDEIIKLAKLKDDGLIDEKEFKIAKSKLLDK